jgi:hypothetical protein
MAHAAEIAAATRNAIPQYAQTSVAPLDAERIIAQLMSRRFPQAA